MQILDKNKDYYDHYSKIYGIDKSTTFDRRNSKKFDSKEDFLWYIVDPWLKHSNSHGGFHEQLDAVLEIGYVQYLLCFKNIIFSFGPDLIQGNLEFVRKFDEHQNYFDKEITLTQNFQIKSLFPHNYRSRFVDYYRKFDNFQQNVSFDIPKYRRKGDELHNFILAKTGIQQHIEAQEVWMNISNFISAKYNDKIIDIELTDKQKAENHGFDPEKYAFRPLMK